MLNQRSKVNLQNAALFGRRKAQRNKVHLNELLLFQPNIHDHQVVTASQPMNGPDHKTKYDCSFHMLNGKDQ